MEDHSFIMYQIFVYSHSPPIIQLVVKITWLFEPSLSIGIFVNNRFINQMPMRACTYVMLYIMFVIVVWF